MAPPIITLTTDFGLRDPFVAIVKGVILGICPGASLIDLTHEVARHDVREGGLALESAWRFFPVGSIHLAVIDPGVGTARRALALSAGGHCFVGPDNGLFTFAIQQPGWVAVSIEAPRYRLSAVSQTFHGRDIFAPAAAHLASGVPLERLGPPVADPIRRPLPSCRLEGDELVGEVIGSDRFGNLVTSLAADRIAALAPCGGVRVRVGSRELGPLVETYAAGAPDVPSAIIGSSGRLEIFVRNGSALALLRAACGTPVRLGKARET
ncbi:MAG TPA: SAM-dependent chlorinase/fluorinase [Methylomirabilota bacterium]|nr:SAM-dependent chlorinase/fluorinase [Methylomirabilota bacterium]